VDVTAAARGGGRLVRATVPATHSSHEDGRDRRHAEHRGDGVAAQLLAPLGGKRRPLSLFALQPARFSLLLMSRHLRVV